MPKSESCLLRLSAADSQALTIKSKVLGLNKSELLRKGAFSFWGKKGLLADELLKMFQDGDEATKTAVVDLLAEYFTIVGYPHNKLSPGQLTKEMIKIAQSKSPLMEGDFLQMNTVGLSVPNYFHPHMEKVKCGKYRTPWDQYSDPLLLRDAIRRWMVLGKKPSRSGIRRILRTRDGVRSVVNFKPVIAKFFYDNYCPIGGKVLDPCSGFSGRACAAIASNKNLFYHGIDPMGLTAVGNMKLASFFSSQYEMFGRTWKFGFRFDLGCAEEIMPTLPSKSYNLSFSSYPYHNQEVYSNEPTQSCIRYKEYEVWREKFLAVLIKESKRLLVEDGHLIINIKNYKKKPIADDTISIAEECGFRLVKTYHQKMAKSEYSRSRLGTPEHATATNWHTEPILVFQ